ncbi:hypothetical protein MMYC01_203600 [Madurella mycetomatis]|uniref:Uncharacterized protein n=1 Tax=Madurella mycetomatis TaxID=100816 RepID=A0A175W9V5_9PEZI|nr:hypothetical protein MMYC01_203600 [Madurella mycetomatis]
MSVFSMIKRGRQAAKEHRAEQAEKEKKEAAKPPYKHIPKHAAIDALSGGPAGWREHDRQRIVEQNRRRSAMTASGVGMSGMITPVHAGMPRVSSSLSHVSYPSAYASPVVQVPRNYSYGSMPPGWTSQGGEMSYTSIDMASSMSPKGKEVERIVLDSSRTSRSSSKVSTSRVLLPLGNGDATVSPAESSSNSSSSGDDLEMRPTQESAPTSVMRSSRPVSEIEPIHRLHPGHSRRVSDPNHSSATPSRSPHTPRNSPRNTAIPPVPALPPMQFGAALSTSGVSSSAVSTASLVTMVPAASSTPLEAGMAASVVVPAIVEPETIPEVCVTPEPSSEEDFASSTAPTTPSIVAAAPAMAESPGKRGRRISKMTRFSELETIRSNVSVVTEATDPSAMEPAKVKKDERRPTATMTALPTSFDETSLSAPKAVDLPRPSPASSLRARLRQAPN